jgi:hypothetical protein
VPAKPSTAPAGSTRSPLAVCAASVAGELNSVRKPKLMWRKAAADTGIDGEPVKLATHRGA